MCSILEPLRGNFTSTDTSEFMVFFLPYVCFADKADGIMGKDLYVQVFTVPENRFLSLLGAKT